MKKQMNFKDFVGRLQGMEDDYNKDIDRKFNVNTCTKYPRKISRYLTFILYKLDFIKGHHVLAAHFVSDLAALYYVYLQDPFGVLGFLLLSHLFDNCDGDLARIRGESDPKWGEIDVHLHLITNMVFWVILGFLFPFLVLILFAARVVCEAHRGEKKYSDRYGERSKLWYWLVLPTNVNMMYLSYIAFAIFGMVESYVVLYMVYHCIIAVGQSVKKIIVTLIRWK